MREKVLSAMQGHTTPTTARLIAIQAGLTHKQTVDSLQYLLHIGAVVRHGSKSVSRWAIRHHSPRPTDALAEHLAAILRKRGIQK